MSSNWPRSMSKGRALASFIKVISLHSTSFQERHQMDFDVAIGHVLWQKHDHSFMSSNVSDRGRYIDSIGFTYIIGRTRQSESIISLKIDNRSRSRFYAVDDNAYPSWS